jgi:cytochrome c553
MKPAKTLSLAVLSLAIAATSAQAGGDPEAGQKKSQVCQACHGADGKGTNPAYPVLAGQYADYMEHAMKAYRDGGRKNVIMAGIAAPLSDQDIADLAAFYASLDGLQDLSIK